MECKELNCLCKHMNKIRRSQPAILCTEMSKTQLFSVSIFKVIFTECQVEGYQNILKTGCRPPALTMEL